MEKIILKSLPIGITGIKFDSDLPKVFKESKDKAVICGKMLALRLNQDHLQQLLERVVVVNQQYLDCY